MEAPSPKRAVARFGLFEANLTDRLLTRSGSRVKLQDQPFRILVMLLERSGEIVSREEIRQNLWPENTYVEFDDGLNTAMRKLRVALSDTADNPRFIETVPRKGYRFVAPVTLPTTAALPPNDREFVALPSEPEHDSKPRSRSRFVAGGIGLAALLSLVIAVTLYRHRSYPSSHFQPRDTIVLADFDNTTEETLFDDTLKRALVVDLEQSPFFRLISEHKVSETLRLMQRSPSERLTQKIAFEVCNRLNAKALIVGSISNIGSKYLLGLAAVRCSTGEPIAHEQGVADRKEDVVEALGKLASQLRGRLGESLASIHEHDVPLEQATTISLEALRAYNTALKTWDKQGDKASIPFFKRAIELDPNFAMAYAGLGTIYRNLHESILASANITKAFEMRERLTESERFSIESRYYSHVTGELDKSTQVYQLQQRMHPDSISAHANLGGIYVSTGQFEKAAAEYREALRLDPGRATSHANLAFAYLALNRVDEAEQIIAEARKRQLHGEFLLQIAYWLAVLRDNATEMQAVVVEGSQETSTEAIMLVAQANTAAYHGQLRESRKLIDNAVEMAKRNGEKEVAAEYLAEAALREADVGESGYARRYAHQALTLAPGRDIQTLAALTFARVRDDRIAQGLADDLNQRFPANTILQGYWLPMVHASLQLNRGNNSRAIEVLQRSSTYDLADAPPVSAPTFYPAYLRGSAYLAKGDGESAAAEYRKFLEHRAIVANLPLGALAYLGLGRAYALIGDVETSRTDYERFLSLWKDADPNLPVLKSARSEYALLRHH